MRLFVAIDINDNVHKAVAKLQQELKGRLLKNQKSIKWVEPENMHLTLKFLGETDENRVGEIGGAVEVACADKKAFEFSLSTVGTFGRPVKVLWLGSEKPSGELVKLAPLETGCPGQPSGSEGSLSLTGLAGDLENALEELGFEKETRPFSTHLTLARIKDNIDRDLQRFLKDYSKVKIPQISVDSVCLYKSQLTPNGPVYTLLRKIELNPVRDKES